MIRQYSLNYILTGFFLRKLNTVSSCIKHSRARTRTRTHIHTHTHKHTRAHTRTHARTHKHTHAHTHAHTCGRFNYLIRTCVRTCVRAFVRACLRTYRTYVQYICTVCMYACNHFKCTMCYFFGKLLDIVIPIRHHCRKQARQVNTCPSTPALMRPGCNGQNTVNHVAANHPATASLLRGRTFPSGRNTRPRENRVCRRQRGRQQTTATRLPR